MYGLFGSTLFSHIITQMAGFSRKKKKVTEHKICVVICNTNISETFRILRRIQGDIGINVRKSS